MEFYSIAAAADMSEISNSWRNEHLLTEDEISYLKTRSFIDNMYS